MALGSFSDFEDSSVASVYDNYPIAVRDCCMKIRELVYDVASSDERIGPIEETLRWGEPSYIPSQTKSGSMVRIAHHGSKSFDYGVYFVCSTTLVSGFMEQYPDVFRYGGNRCLEFMVEDAVDWEALRDCIYQAFTYYLKK